MSVLLADEAPVAAKRIYPWAPVARHCALRGAETTADIARATGVSATTISRVAAIGRLTEDQADRFAVALGFHPLNLWPEWGSL